MGALSRSERLCKAIFGSCLIAAPALLLVAGLLQRKETTDPARQYKIISTSVDRWQVNWITAASMLVMAGAVLGLAHLMHEQRPAEGIFGGAVALTGVLAAFVVAAETMVVAELGRSSETAPSAAALHEPVLELGPTRWTVLLVAVLLLPVGLVVMGAGLYRAQVVPTWAAAALGVGALLFAASLPTDSGVMLAIGLTTMAVGMLPIGWEVLGETDEEWEHPPRLGAHPAT